MVPELKFKFALPGFGSLELESQSDASENNVNEILIKFVPTTPCKDQNGWAIRLFRDGGCYVQEIKPLPTDEEFEGVGVA